VSRLNNHQFSIPISLYFHTDSKLLFALVKKKKLVYYVNIIFKSWKFFEIEKKTAVN
jgi:hypothetical protein